MTFPEDSSDPSTAKGKSVEESSRPSKSIPSLQLKKLLVPTDFSANSKKALVYAVRLAQRNDSRLWYFPHYNLVRWLSQAQPSVTAPNGFQVPCLPELVRYFHQMVV